jgi:hypothetical protein
MDDTTRFRLLGTYRTPRFRPGQRVTCERRGLSAGRIPWPLGRPAISCSTDTGRRRRRGPG